MSTSDPVRMTLCLHKVCTHLIHLCLCLLQAAVAGEVGRLLIASIWCRGSSSWGRPIDEKKNTNIDKFIQKNLDSMMLILTTYSNNKNTRLELLSKMLHYDLHILEIKNEDNKNSWPLQLIDLFFASLI